MSASHLLRAGLGLLALAPLSSAGILTVGPAGSGAQFTEIQAAIDAALEDDVILVGPGTYGRIVVDKPLRILGDGTGAVRIDAPFFGVKIRGIDSGEEVVLSGIEILPSSNPMVQLTNCAGTVVLQDLDLSSLGNGVNGIGVANCARVLLLDSRIVAEDNLPISARDSELWLANVELRASTNFFGDGSPGASVERSTLHLWRSRIVGADSFAVFFKLGAPGGAGIRAVHSTVEVFGGPGSEIRGGRGSFDSMFGDNFPGGPGVDLLEDSHARAQESVPFVGGLDGLGVVSAPGFRVDGTSSFTREPRIFPTLASSASQAQLGGSLALTLSGNPGGFQILFLSLGTGPTMTLPGVDGLGLLDRPLLRRLVGETLPPASSQTVSLRVPATPALLGSTLFFQAAERSVSGFAISNPALVTITR